MGAVAVQTAHQRVADRIARDIGSDRFARFFTGTRFECDDRTLALHVPSAFHRDWLTRRFGAVVDAAARAEMGDVGVHWCVGDLAKDTSRLRRPPQQTWDAPPAAKPVCRSTQRAGRAASLESFVVGEPNRLAHGAAMRIADEASPGFNVLFVHGGCAVGKTHLLQAIAARYGARRPGSKARCISAERFVNEYVTAVRGRELERFRARYRQLELLCIDDAHFLAGKKATQTEFANTFEALAMSGARIVLASDEHPQRIRALSSSIRSRCLSGMVVSLDAPDRAMRRSIAAGLAARRGVALAPDAIDAIVNACAPCARELEGAVTRVAAIEALLPGASRGATLDATAIRRAIGASGGRRPERPIRVREILDACAESMDVQPTDVLGSGRHRRIVLARAMTAALARDLTTHSFPEIARVLGRANHSTIVTACQRLRRQIEADERCQCGGELDQERISDVYDRVRARLLAAAR
ncbi:MAG: DnaA/Hda family protein [Planctomycetota bacterium]